MTEQLEPAPRDELPLGRLVAGVALIIVGFGALADSAGWFDVPWDALLPALLILVGLALMVGSRTGRHRGVFVFGVVLLVLLAVGTTARITFSGGFGDRFVAVTDVGELQDTYELGFGDLDLDLSGLTLPEGITDVRIRLGVGDANIRLPAGAEVFVEARTSVGDVSLPNGTESGFDTRLSHQTPGFDTATSSLVLDIRVSVGSIRVVPA